MEIELEPQGHFIIQRLTSHQQMLISFYIGYQVEQRAGLKRERYSIDTRHGTLHEHVHGHQKPNDAREIRPLYSQVDVQESFDWAYEAVFTKYLRLTGRA